MFVETGSGGAAAGLDRATREEVRQSTFKAFLTASTLFAVWGWWHYYNGPASVPELRWMTLGTGLALLSVCVLAVEGSRWSRPAYLITVGAAITLCQWMQIFPHAGYLWALAALVAGALVHPVAGVAAGALGAAVTMSLGAGGLPEASVSVFGGVLVWLALRPLYDLLRRYSAQSLEAVTLAERLRDERAKLNRTIRDLDASYRLMERTSRELALACREADALRDLRHQFATNLSHELRTPLNIILGFSRLVYSHPEMYGYDGWGRELMRDLAEIQRSAGYLSQLVDDIVDLARADALSMPVRREPCDIAALAREAVELVRNLARGRGIAVELRLGEAGEPIAADPVRIRQVLFNLLTNAVRHTESGTVTVMVREEGDEVVVTVRDTGRGIPAAELETIFSEFYQLGQPVHGEEPGKGLGLAIAKRFVQLHGGRIWVESEVGVGSSFHFSLPRISKSFSSPLPAAAPAYGAKLQPQVLLLGDDGPAGHYLSRRLEGFQFVPVPDLSAGAADGDLARASAVLINRPLSGGDDDGTERLLNLLPPHLPVIECCLPTPAWLRDRGLFAEVLTKPVGSDALLAVVHRFVGDKEKARILVADDDRGFTRLISRMLNADGPSGLELLTAYSGDEALGKARSQRPDLILMDLLMPGMPGFEAAEAIRADPELSQVPVVAVTAATPGEDRVEASGASLTVLKRGGFSPGELTGLLQHTLEELTRRAPDHPGSR
ncbi:MAG: hybrid sensor histidine kinase/response regulator [Anaerolineae bacterium]|nr:hybrid sensor histidine kinase/response regulator [Anaerolineae bacterium]